MRFKNLETFQFKTNDRRLERFCDRIWSDWSDLVQCACTRMLEQESILVLDLVKLEDQSILKLAVTVGAIWPDRSRTK